MASNIRAINTEKYFYVPLGLNFVANRSSQSATVVQHRWEIAVANSSSLSSNEYYDRSQTRLSEFNFTGNFFYIDNNVIHERDSVEYSHGAATCGFNYISHDFNTYWPHEDSLIKLNAPKSFTFDLLSDYIATVSVSSLTIEEGNIPYIRLTARTNGYYSDGRLSFLFYAQYKL